MPNPVADQAALRRRLVRFWSDNSPQKSDLHRLCDALKSVGEVAVLGGMVRDFARGGAASFNSDIDLVLDVESEKSTEALLKKFSYSKNRFGGWRVRLDRWLVDVWSVQSTWAIANADVRVSSFQDLTRTTFFNWDAALFDLHSHRLYLMDNYLYFIQSGILSVNLPANPDPASMVIRTLRTMQRQNAAITADLALYLVCAIGRDIDAVVQVGLRKNFSWASTDNLRSIRHHLIHYLRRGDDGAVFRLSPFQATLSFPRGNDVKPSSAT